MKCLSCQSSNLFEIYDFGQIPLVNAFSEDCNISSKKFPLSVWICQDCWVCQLGDVPDPELIFTNYMHFSNASIDNTNHLSRTASEINSILNPHSKILEVGCNDGTLLGFLETYGHQIKGVDPAKNMATLEIHKRNRTIFGNYGPETYDQILAANMNEKFDCILGLNVFAHFAKVQEAFSTTEMLLNDTGVFIFEVAYALNTLFKGSYDTVYHEHVFNHTLTGLSNMLRKAGLKIIGATRLPTQGGSLRIYANKIDTNSKINIPKNEFIEITTDEINLGINRLDFYKQLKSVISGSIEQIKSTLNSFITNPDEKIFLIGAPARGVVVANTCGFENLTNLIPIDDTKEKLSKFFPGLNCKVHSWDAVDKNIDVKKSILLSWNYKATMIEKLKAKNFQGEMVAFMPNIEITQL